ncbi:MAG: ACT domain-containing protein [Clostridia bacterium]|nr:ACT domain-containing protein [Clostridia bacterium]
MIIKHLDFDITVCQVENAELLDVRKDFYFVGKTEKEISLVCKTEDVPARTLQREDGWQGFYIDGTLDFSLVGILSRIAGLLADQGISIFALSTYNTDYVLVKKADFSRAMDILSRNGYNIVA